MTPDATLVSGATQAMLAVGRDADGRVVSISPVWSLAAGGGAMSQTGMFTAGAVTGLFPRTVVATDGSISGSASITVTPGQLASITVVPDPVTLAVRTTQQFTAVGKDAFGNIVQFTPTWSVVAGGGTIDHGGIFTAGGTPGTYSNTVQASSLGLKAFAMVTVTVGPLASITVTPNPDTLGIGAQQQFVAAGKDNSGNTVPIAATWSVVAGGGTIDGAGLFTAGTTPGTFTNTVKATSGSLSATATVVVTAGQLARITVTPNPATMRASGTQRFTAVGTDVAGNPVTITPGWSVVAGGGTVNETGLFTAGTVSGTFASTVRAASGGLSGFATVIVAVGPLASITVTPNPVFMPTNSTQAFVAVGRDANGNVFAMSPAWSVVNGGGSIDVNTGLFTAGGVAGTFGATIKATSGTVAGYATVTVTPVLAAVTVTPNPTTLPIHGVQLFTAVGTDASGNVVPITPTWSVVAGGGTINSGGQFTARTAPGTYANTVRATSGGFTATATVNVTAGPLAAITVTPNPAVLAINGAQLFTAVGTDGSNNVIAITPIWAVDPAVGGGSITSGGTFTAGVAAGTFANAVTATSSGVTARATVQVATASQTITFVAPAAPAVYGSTFAIAPTATSLLPVTVTATGGCSFVGGTVTMTSGTLDCVLTAAQVGDGTWTAAVPVVQTVAAATLPASVTPNAASKAFGAADPIPMTSGTLAGFLGGDAVVATYSRAPGEAVGTYVISAVLGPAGVLGNYAITYNTATFTIGVAAQTITFAAPATPAVYEGTFAVAPTASSGLAVTVTPTGGCSIALGTVTMTSGSVNCVLSATQAGNATWMAALPVVQTVVASLAPQTVVFGALAGKTVGDAPFAVSATGGSSGIAVAFAAGPAGVCTVSGSTVTLAGAGTCTVTASQAGNANYAAAANVARVFTVAALGPLAQTITFAAPASPAVYGSTFAVAPTASSGLGVTVTPSGSCSIAGGTVTMTSGSGTCTLTATQAGNASYSAAPPVVQTVVASLAPQTVVFGALAGKAVGDAPFAVSATGGGSGNAVTFAASPGGVCTVSGSTVTLTGAGTCTVTASQAGNANYAAAADVAQAFAVAAAAQTITFAAPATPAVYGSTFAVAPTASSGLGVTVTPSGSCSIAGGTVTMTSGSGTCTLTASQAGNGNYAAATSVLQTVAASLRTASVTPNAASKAYGVVADPALTGTLTGFLAGDAVIASYSRVAGSAVGGYTISATLGPVGVLGNYSITYDTDTFSITFGLGASATFAVLGGSGASSCIGVSKAYGNVGMDPGGTISGFDLNTPCAIVAPGDGVIHLNDATAAAAQADVTAAVASLSSMACTTDLSGSDLAGLNLAPGVYCFTSSAALTGTLTLNGPATGLWVFRAVSTLTTSAGSKITLAGSAQSGNVYWQVGSSATIGATNTAFRGTIIAYASVDLGAGTTLAGRALARTGAVTMNTNTITLP